MKKTISMILLLCMVFALCACGQPAAETPAEAPAEAPAVEAPVEEAPVEEAPAAAAYTLGMGIDIDADSSAENKAQVDATVAAVVLDAEGKIVLCRIDCVQNKMDVTGGAVDTAATYQTKMELGDAYGMVAYGNAIAEWDAQTKAFEEFVVGLTAAEVEALETREHNNHQVPVDETLYAGCTMDIVGFKTAVVEACNDAWAVSFETADEFTLGVAAISEASESVAATAEADAEVKMYSEYAAAVVDANGVILAAVNDATQPVVNVDLNGAITGSTVKGTKRELGENYNMVKFGNAIAEWDAQSAAFSEYVIGLTADEVLAIETTQNDHGYSVPADEALYAGCTMQITGMMAVVAQAANYAR